MIRVGLPLLAFLLATSAQAQAKFSHWDCGAIMSMHIIPGMGYQPGTYPVDLVGGDGHGATAKITVPANGMPGNIEVVNEGADYHLGNVLTADLPKGSGFKLIVTNVMALPRDTEGQRMKLSPRELRGVPPAQCQ